jgi:hypothetical protein
MNGTFTSYAAVLMMPAVQVVQQQTIRRAKPVTSAIESLQPWHPLIDGEIHHADPGRMSRQAT